MGGPSSSFCTCTLSVDSPGMFFIWGVRSADTDGDGGFGVHDIAEQNWKDRNFVYWGGPGYETHVIEIEIEEGQDRTLVIELKQSP